MRRFLAALAASLLPLTALTALATPAQAGNVDKTCKTHTHDMGLTTRNCDIKSSRTGGYVRLWASWDYPQGSARGRYGYVNFQITDRIADGKCTFVKVKYRDTTKYANPNETIRRKACSGNTSKVHDFVLNGGEAAGGADGGGPFPVYEKGVYSVEHCSGKKCNTIWRQDVAKQAP